MFAALQPRPLWEHFPAHASELRDHVKPGWAYLWCAQFLRRGEHHKALLEDTQDLCGSGAQNLFGDVRQHHVQTILGHAVRARTGQYILQIQQLCQAVKPCHPSLDLRACQILRPSSGEHALCCKPQHATMWLTTQRRSLKAVCRCMKSNCSHCSIPSSNRIVAVPPSYRFSRRL